MVTTTPTSGDQSSHPQPKPADHASTYNRKTEILALESTKTGVKGLVDSGLSKIPRIFLNTSTPAAAAATAPNSGIPIIDLEGVRSSEERKKAVVEELRAACGEWGFFQVVNHGVPLTVLDGIIEGVRRFHEMEDDVKKTYYSREESRKFKYNTNFDLLTGKVANWRDSLCCIMGPHQPLPHEIPEVCRDIIFEYTNQMKKVGLELLELMSEALGLRPDHLKELDLGEGIYLQGHYYPSCPEPELAIGFSSHADNCFFTILLQDNTGGLQILHDGQWVDVCPFSGALVVNIGDLLQVSTMSYKFLKIADTYDIRDVDDYTNPLSEPRLSRDMWRDEMLGVHEYERECCSILYGILNEYKAERDATFRKLQVAEKEIRQSEGVVKALEDKVASLELENQQLHTERDALTYNNRRDADTRNLLIMFLVGMLVGIMFRF